MFNLDQAISEWRQKMAAGGIKTSVVLDELESHLREDAERLAKSGVLSAEEAFRVAESRIGQSELLRAEFAKIDPLREARWVRMIGIGCGVFAVLTMLWFAPWMLFAHELTASERVLGWTPVALTLFSVVSWRFSYRFLPVIRSRRARVIAGFVCGLVSLGGIYIFGLALANVIVPRVINMPNLTMIEPNAGHTGGRLMGVQGAPEFSQMFMIGISILWAVAVAAIPGAIAFGLEEAVRRRMKENAYV